MSCSFVRAQSYKVDESMILGRPASGNTLLQLQIPRTSECLWDGKLSNDLRVKPRWRFRQSECGGEAVETG